MPVFLTPAAWDTWLAPEKIVKDQTADLVDLLDVESRAVASTLQTHPVSRTVNNVRTLDRHDPGLIAPARDSPRLPNQTLEIAGPVQLSNGQVRCRTHPAIGEALWAPSEVTTR